jgi:RND superfamily putative drug exporter
VQKTLAGTLGVASVTAPQVNQAGDTAVMTVVPTTGPQDPATTDLVDDLRDDVLPSVGAPAYVTGTTAGYVDFTEKAVQRLPWLIGAVVLLSLLLLSSPPRLPS